MDMGEESADTNNVCLEKTTTDTCAVTKNNHQINTDMLHEEGTDPQETITTTTTAAARTFLAKALYDNLAESPNELAFRRGDVLTVLEQDTDGMAGWWRCMHHGQVGIAPGNRLKILTGMVENGTKDVANLDKHHLNAAVPSALSWQRRSWDVTPNKVGGQTDADAPLYDHPPVRHSQEDYDVPPPRNFDTSGSTQDLETNYDTLPRNKTDVSPSQPIYNSPSSNRIIDSFNNLLPDAETYDVLPSNRSSMASFVSTESTMTLSSSASNLSLPRSSNTSSLCDSARSSLDVSALYDVPPDHGHGMRQQFNDSVLDLYDTPPSRTKNSPPTSSLIEDYDVPKSAYDDYDIPPVEPSNFDMPSLVFEHALDELYDIPKNNAPVPEGANLSFGSSSSGKGATMPVYDIPPQVSRDSMLSAKSDSSDGQDIARLSTCSSDSRGSDIPIYNELPLSLDAAMEQLVKRRQCVQKAIFKMSSFISSTWRLKENLEPKLYEIQLAANGVKISMSDFVEFAEGTLANSVKTCDSKLANKLYKLLSPIQKAFQQIIVSCKRLDEIGWQINLLESNEVSKDDDLGKIATLSKELPHDVRNLASFIQGNAVLLFKSATDAPTMKMEPNKTDKQQSKIGLESIPATALSRRHSSDSVQSRPLPPPPPINRPLPPTPNQLSKAWVSERLPSKDLTKTKPKKVDDGDTDSIDSLEYDYVQLETRDSSPEKIVPPAVPNKKQTPYGSKISLGPDTGKVPTINEKSEAEKLAEYESSLEAAIDSMQKGIASIGDTPTPSFPEMSDAAKTDSAVLIMVPDKTQYSKDVEDISKGLDYVSLSKSLDIDFDKELKTPTNINPNANDIMSFTNLNIVGTDKPVMQKRLDPNDRQVLLYYSEQIDTHYTLLSNSIEAFYNCIDSIEPPKVFISNSKFVVLSATKLVYIGDTLHRNLMDIDFRNRIMQLTTLLCDNLKLTVTSTKTAALYYPSVQAVQDMVDRVRDVFTAAHELKNIISQTSVL